MKDFKFYIRFGVHKDRGVIKSLRDSISGMFIPAHILCYSTNATIAAIKYINKGYYIDPMTYIYADGIQAYVVPDIKGSQDKKFKPSIAKLTDNFGLAEFFKNNNFEALTPKDILDNDLFAEEFCKKNIELQMNKIEDEKKGAYKKYADLLRAEGEDEIAQEIENALSPEAIIPPYFYFDSMSDEWLKVNLKLADMTRQNSKLPVVPIIFTLPNVLCEEILDLFKDYNKIFVWADDLEQKQSIGSSQQSGLEKFADFIKSAKEKKVEVINMYGSYFSILLSKIGLAGMCNGIFYGEYKSRKTKGGGIPPSRYYIRKLHEFYAIPEATTLLRKYPELLDIECDNCMNLIGGNIENIFSFDADHSLAQSHFVYSREREINNASENKLVDLLNDMDDKYLLYGDKIPDENITKKNIEYLKIWKEILMKYSK